MPASETDLHQRLKALALAWAQASGFAIAAAEVRVPRSGYRADVAAYAPRRRDRPEARTAIFECKQARADLLKDAHAEAATRARLAELIARRRTLEELLAVHRPDLRRGEALWPEFDSWDFSSLEHRAYRGVLDELETVQRRVQGGTKFSKMFRYRCADFLYLVVEENIFAVLEVAEPNRAARHARLEQLLGEFGLGPLRDSPAMSLSGGERRRCEIARAMAAEPSIMLLDEPFAGIDPISISDIRDLVRELKQRDIGVLITDHNVRETLDIVDRACIIYDGQLLVQGTPEALVADPEVRRLYLGESFAL